MMRHFRAGLAAVLLSTMFAMSLWSAKADQPESDSAAATRVDDESVEVRLARAHLELAKLDLRSALEGNKRIPNLYPAEYVEKLQLHVVIDEAELEQSLKGVEKDSHEVCIRSAEASVKIAEADLNGVRAYYQRIPTNANALAVERAEVVATISKLNLERTKHLEDSESVLIHLQWQIDQLRHQVLELEMRK